jgi:hypothetical protein
MNIKPFLTYIFIGTLLMASFTSCSSKSEKQSENYSSSGYDKSPSDYSGEEENNDKNENYSASSGCKFDDGTYSATVDYYNPETGYNQTYTLDVEVEDCKIVQIDFPNGGWLDSAHITPTELDEDENCTEALCFVSSSVLADSFVLRNPLLRQAPKR